MLRRTLSMLIKSCEFGDLKDQLIKIVMEKRRLRENTFLKKYITETPHVHRQRSCRGNAPLCNHKTERHKESHGKKEKVPVKDVKVPTCKTNVQHLERLQ